MPRVPRMANRTFGALSAAGSATAGHGPSGRTRRGPAHRLIGKPTGDVVVLGPASLHNVTALFHHPFPVARQIPERLERSVLVQNARADYYEIPNGDGEPVAPVKIRRHVFQ